MRQVIKYTLFILYYSVLTYLFYKIYGSKVEIFDVLIPILLLLTGFLSFIFSGSGIKMVHISPKLDKKIIHESGNYYIRYSTIDQNYILYKDLILYKESIYTFEANSKEEILSKVKKELDNTHKDLIKKINTNSFKKKILDETEGYTSVQLKREDKISKIL